MQPFMTSGVRCCHPRQSNNDEMAELEKTRRQDGMVNADLLLMLELHDAPILRRVVNGISGMLEEASVSLLGIVTEISISL